MAEKIYEKINPNVLKSAATAVAIGSIAVPASSGQSPEEVPQTTPKTVAIRLNQNRYHHHHNHPKFTGYVVRGRTSTFGWPSDSSSNTTADGGDTKRPCIAIRNDATLRHKFQVSVLGHQAVMPECDYGPDRRTGRNIDITGDGVMLLHMNPWNYPTGAWGVVRELH